MAVMIRRLDNKDERRLVVYNLRLTSIATGMVFKYPKNYQYHQ